MPPEVTQILISVAIGIALMIAIAKEAKEGD
jgi:hypothetical protein